MTKATLKALFIAGASISMLSACSDGPTGPAKPVGPAFMTNVQVIGPSTIEPGGTASFKMTTTWSDGSTRDVTSETTWISSRPDIVSISATGVATAHERGASTVIASIGVRTASRNVIVVPTGTYQLSGRVMEGTSIPVPGARVETISAAGTLTATTAQDGTFTLYGVGPSAELRVSKEGYAPHSQPVALANHVSVVVSLKPNGPALDISGTYTLTISADGCGSSMHEELRRRSYPADVTQQPDQVVIVTLRGAGFSTGAPQRVFGSAGAASVVLRFPEADWYYGNLYVVQEPLPDGTFLIITGIASLAPAADGLRGTLSGTISHLKTLQQGPTLGQCGSTAHGFVMTRSGS